MGKFVQSSAGRKLAEAHQFLVSVCALGALSPPTVECDAATNTGERHTREDYLGEVEFLSSNSDVAGVLSGFSKINTANGAAANTIEPETEPAMGSAYATHDFGSGKPCGLPEKIDDALLYK